MNLLIFGLNYDNFSDIEKEIFWQLKSYILNKIPTIIFENRRVNNDSPKLKRSLYQPEKLTFLTSKRPKTNYDHETAEGFNQFNIKKYRKICHKIERRISKSIVLNELNNYLEDN